MPFSLCVYLLDYFYGVAGNHEHVAVENVIDIERAGGCSLDAGDVSGALCNDLVIFGGNDKRFLFSTDSFQKVYNGLGLVGFSITTISLSTTLELRADFIASLFTFLLMLTFHARGFGPSAIPP